MAQSQGYCFGSAGNSQLGKNTTNMRLNRGWAYSKPPGDLSIVEPFDH